MRCLRICCILVGFVWFLSSAVAQDKVADEPPWLVQFDGKTLQGWEIEGQSAVEDGAIKLGGAAAATLRLKMPLGDKFSMKFESQWTGPSAPALRWDTDAVVPTLWFFPQMGGSTWADLTVTASQGKWFNSNSGSFSVRTLDNSYTSSGGLSAGAGPVRDLVIVVNPGTTLTIRRIALQTTTTAPAVRLPWASIIVLIALLVSVVGLGWLLNRHRSTAPGSAAPRS